MKLQTFTPFLTFNGNAEEAMRYYASRLPGAEVTALVRYGESQPYAEKEDAQRILHGVVSFMGGELLFLDMDAAHPAPSFGWSTSLYVNCLDETEFDAIFAALSEEGLVMMGPEAVAHVRKCAWVTDKFGVTWQPVWK